MKKNKSILFSLGFTIVILTSSCGGGSGSPGDGDGSNPPSGDINPGLSGKLFFKEKTERNDGSEISEAWIMDMATGKYTKIPNTNWADQEDQFPGNWDNIGVAPVGYDGSEFVVAVDGCKNNPDRSCVAIQDKNGNYLDRFDVYGKVHGAKMSRDRQYIALFRSSVSAKRRMEIYDRDGALQGDRLKFDYVFYYDWLPNGRIVFAIQRSLYFTEPYSTQVESIKTLPNNLQGEDIFQIAVSPDGERLAFTVDGTPYIMNIDGTSIRKLAIVGYKEEPGGTGTAVNNIAWSPDGQWILLGEGGGGVWPPPPPSIGAPARVNYVVPAEDMGKIFILENSPEVRVLRRYRVVEESIDSSVTDRGFSQSVAWLP